MPAAHPNPTPPNDEGWRRGELWVLFGITLLGAIVRLSGVERWSMVASEVATWQAVTMPLHGADGFFAGDAARHPVVHLGLRWLLDLGVLSADGQGHMRLPFVFAGLMSVPLLALAASLVAARRTALLAAGLLAVHPWHVGQSQTMAPPVVATAFVLVAITAALAAPRRWHRSRLVVCLLAAALACASDRSGVVVVPLLAGGWLLRRWLHAERAQRRGIEVGLVLLAVLPAALQALGVLAPPVAADGGMACIDFVGSAGPSVLVLALLAPAVCRPVPAMAFAAGWLPVIGFACAAMVGAGIEANDLLATSPVLLWLAAATAVRCADRVHRAAGGVPGLVGAAVVPLALVTALAVGTVLHATVYGGHRSPWQQAAHLALGGYTSAGGLVVGAGEGAPSLTFYLQPDHWRDPVRAAGSGVRVVPLAGDPDAALAALLAGANGSAVRLVLTVDEREAFARDEAAERRLRASCRLLRVLPRPRESGDATLYVFASRGAD